MKQFLFYSIWLFCSFFPNETRAQEPFFFTKIILPPVTDSVLFSNKPVLSYSISITTLSNDTLSTDLYAISPLKGMLYWHASYPSDSLIIYYKNIPKFIAPQYKLRSTDIIQSQYDFSLDDYITNNQPSNNLIKNDDLLKTGSISRGVSLGNNQSLIVNSNLDLQLSGKLSDEIEIKAALSDQNIPFQPEGTTAQLQEFDQVYVNIAAPYGNLTLGDFQVKQHQSDYFLQVFKKAQGAMVTTSLQNNGKKLDIGAAFAVARGKFSRNTFNGIEGNQGPYRLTGTNNELFIILIAGTERVFLNGISLERGEQNDYIIDYNLGEITFTTNKIITQFDRIVVEFQYADNSYQRSISHFFLGQKTNKNWWRANYYRESDNRNRSFFTELSDEDKRTLALAGDSNHLAVKLAIDTVFTADNPIRYRIKDSLYNGRLYQDILEFTPNLEAGKYRATFSFVGSNQGNYILRDNLVNGRVYSWIAPDASGRPQGDYEPYVQLISPISQEMATFATGTKIGKYSKISTELARSVYDKNSFSSFDAEDNVGFANKTRFSMAQPLNIKDTSNSWRFVNDLSYEYVSANFTAIERFRTVEFDRDWNNTLDNNTLQTGAQHHFLGQIGFEKKGLHQYLYHFSMLNTQNVFEGYKHGITANSRFRRNEVLVKYQTTDVNREANQLKYYNQFDRLETSLKRNMDLVAINVQYAQEENEFEQALADSLLNASNGFKTVSAYISQGDSVKNEFELGYARRYNLLPYQNDLAISSISNDFSSSFGLTQNKKRQLRWRFNYRTLNPISTIDSLSLAENTVLNRIEYNLKLIKGLIATNSYYQVGTGRERQVEIVYLKVPPGAGTHVWFDLNGDGIEDLGEFRQQEYTGQGNYIRTFINNNDYINAVATEFNQNILIEPAALWRSKKGVLKQIAKLSSQTSASIRNKSRDENNLAQYNPIRLGIDDIFLIASATQLRQSLFFNRLNPKLSLEYTYINTLNKNLFTYGLESSANQISVWKPRIALNERWSLLPQVDLGVKQSRSEGFIEKNYEIQYQQYQLNAQFQIQSSFRLILSYEYQLALNDYEMADDSLQSNKLGFDMTFATGGKGSIQMGLNLYSIQFNNNQNSAVGFAMLNGLRNGNNATWRSSVNYQLSSRALLSLNYEGRKSEENKTIHTGSMNARWMF